MINHLRHDQASEEKKAKANKGKPKRILKESAVKRFFSWTEPCKKVFSRYEIKEISYPGVVINNDEVKIKFRDDLVHLPSHYDVTIFLFGVTASLILYCQAHSVFSCFSILVHWILFL